jgi:hypothetical protein
MLHFRKITLFVGLGLLSGLSTYAQTATEQLHILKAPVNVRVDGKLNEWGDTLAYSDQKSNIHYTIAHDDTMLYVAVNAANEQTLRKIMRGGITVSVNPEGKKHKTYSVTYPVADGKNSAMMLSEGLTDEPRRPNLLQSTSIRVSGFKDVESEIITTANTYGFKAAFNVDQNENLGYEIAIPLKMLDIKKKELAVNIEVNGIQHPANRAEAGREGGAGEGGGGRGMGGGMGGGGGRGGMHGGGGGRRGGGESSGSKDNTGMATSTDFWVKLAL